MKIDVHERPFEEEDFPVARTRRRVLATFSTYRDAQQVVDELSDHHFPVEHTAIVASGLNFVEQVTGRLTWWRAALKGAGTGLVIGLIIGFVFGLLDVFTPLYSAFVLAFWGALIGAGIGLIFGLISYAMSGGERDFTSVGAMRAERYDVQVDPERLPEAIDILESSTRVKNWRRVDRDVVAT